MYSRKLIKTYQQKKANKYQCSWSSRVSDSTALCTGSPSTDFSQSLAQFVHEVIFKLPFKVQFIEGVPEREWDIIPDCGCLST